MNDAERLELESLCNALIDGTIADADKARLEAWLIRDAEALKFYVRFTGMSAGLHHLAGESQFESNVISQRTGSRWPWRLAGGLGAAAAAVIAVAAVQHFRNDSVVPVVAESGSTGEEDRDSVAMLAASENCSWKQGSFLPGTAFYAGQTLELLSGFAEVVFDCGAKIMLEGPTTVSLTSEWEAALRKGTLRATVPQEAIGFRVANPEVDIVDLGTEFSVMTDEAGASEVFVHVGAVQVQPKDKKQVASKDRKMILREKESRRFAKSGGSEVRDADKKWLALGKKVALSMALKPSIYQQWNSISDAKDILVSTGGALKKEMGPKGESWLFDGNYGASLTVPKVSQDMASTLAFWVKIPQDSPLGNAPPMISLRQSKMQGLVEAGTNDDPSHGVVGALALRMGNRKFVGTKSLRDGTWHHVAIVIVRQQREDGGKDLHSKCFVDGRLEARSGKGNYRHNRVKGAPPLESGLWIASGVDNDADEYFQGSLSGITMADGVMSQAEIRQLMAGKIEL